MGCPVPEIGLGNGNILSQLFHQQVAHIFGKPLAVGDPVSDLPFLDPAYGLIGIGHPEPGNGQELLSGPFIGRSIDILVDTGLLSDPGEDIGNTDIHPGSLRDSLFTAFPGPGWEDLCFTWMNLTD